MLFDSFDHLPKFAQDALSAAGPEKLPLIIKHDGGKHFLDAMRNMAGRPFILLEVKGG